MYDNVIVTDYDGCMALYEHSFHMHMVERGYSSLCDRNFYLMSERYNISEQESEDLVRAFNESAVLRRLPPVKDAIKYVRKLHEEHGFVFHVITAIPDTRPVYEARLENIENLFGKTAIERLTLCNHSADKPKYLKEYEGTECLWIEDTPKNALFGLEFGMKPLLMDRTYNMDFFHPEIERVNNWKEIYEIATGQR